MKATTTDTAINDDGFGKFRSLFEGQSPSDPGWIGTETGEGNTGSDF